jgi:hypothetical protein
MTVCNSTAVPSDVGKGPPGRRRGREHRRRALAEGRGRLWCLKRKSVRRADRRSHRADLSCSVTLERVGSPLRFDQAAAIGELVRGAERAAITPAEGLRQLACIQTIPAWFASMAKDSSWVSCETGLRRRHPTQRRGGGAHSLPYALRVTSVFRRGRPRYGELRLSSVLPCQRPFRIRVRGSLLCPARPSHSW